MRECSDLQCSEEEEKVAATVLYGSFEAIEPNPARSRFTSVRVAEDLVVLGCHLRGCAAHFGCCHAERWQLLCDGSYFVLQLLSVLLGG